MLGKVDIYICVCVCVYMSKKTHIHTNKNKNKTNVDIQTKMRKLTDVYVKQSRLVGKVDIYICKNKYTYIHIYIKEKS